MTNVPTDHTTLHRFPTLFVIRFVGLLLIGLALPHALPRIVSWLQLLWSAVHKGATGKVGYTGVLSRTITDTFSRGSTWYGIVVADMIPLSTLVLGLVLTFTRVHWNRTLTRRFATWWNASGFVS